MENIAIFQIDAFTDKIFHGNPAAVCLLSDWLNDELLQAIAVENNLSETAFVMEDQQGFHIRWFTPKEEVNLCGHATLAAGYVLFELGMFENDRIDFISKSGILPVTRKSDLYTLDFPLFSYMPCQNPEIIASLVDQEAVEIFESELDYIIRLDNQDAVAQANVDQKQLVLLDKRGLVLTAAATDADFYSRCFYPKHTIPEDPVTGSAHCMLIPFWAERLNKTSMKAIQGSFRKGEIFCELADNRVKMSGYCRSFSKGHLTI
ncbi:PhzF family phenazine biosynthesis protein [Legionella dresdenensis]|uniref:PhzF family phenazine biosynthesis protein n=1 Tax=Legionella dresdenensis TaxID=450200 RepID=A0ABV8CC38_9GAMM